MKLFLTSDYHLGHFNIIRYCNRPFKSLEHMNKNIIKRHNERISKEDHLIHLGDFCFRNGPGGKEGEGTPKKANYYLQQLRGKITFVRGNHDRNNSLKTYIHALVIKWGGKEYYATHRPEDACSNYSINFVGHVHEKWRFKRVVISGKIIDLINVGVDVWDFRPRTIEEILYNYHKWLYILENKSI